VRFLVDAQLPPALARWLTAEGHEAEHVADCGLESAPDTAIWRYALKARAVLITNDEDFVILRTLERDGPAIVWLRTGNTTKRVLLARMAATLPAIVQALEHGERLIEVV
jgi:predicted nuclease of predicted toxin-antitoxin system